MSDTEFPSRDVAAGELPDAERRASAREDAADESMTSRGALVRRAALVGGAALATGGLVSALPKLASSAASRAGDVRILNYVLRLEYLKAAFYAEAERGGLSGELGQLAGVLARHERAHVAFLKRRLGSEAEDKRRFDFGDATRDPDRFASTARMLEETAVSAYIGQGANLTRRQMVPFAQITSVEARHAAWIDDILGRHPAPLAADRATSPAQVVAVIEKTGFEKG
ncbi:MAG: ferritin-like domain-containing protein [Actinomycetota bacterium]|nr:ferritin-like domain-containing protein [Actinomycetota bacterium]